MDKDKILPPLKIDDNMSIQSIKSTKHTTEPPSRYSEAGLVKKLESLGIGRPSTYAPTISLLTSRDYVKVEKKQLIPNDIAFTITSVLEENFKDIVDSEFTSKMEEKLDDIAENKADWQEVLSNFYHPFIKQIDEGKTNIKSQKVAEPIGEKCPDCGGELVKRKGRFGEFIACLNFPKCKYTKNLANSNKFEKKEPSKIGIQCPDCGGELVERIGKKGKFYGCANYPKCNFLSKYKPIIDKCPKCNTQMVLKELKKGDFKECPQCKFKEEVNNNE